MELIKKSEKPKIILIFEIISALSTASALFGMTKSFLPTEGIITWVAFAIFLTLGYAVSFYLQEEFNRNGFIWWSVGLSLLLSSTYPQNAKPLLNMIEKSKYKEIDPLYYTYIEKIKKYGGKEGGDTESLREERIKLVSQLNVLLADYQAKNRGTISSIKNKVNRDYESAKTHHRYGKWWRKVGVESGCYSVKGKVAGNEALKQARKECLIQYYTSQKIKTPREILELQTQVKNLDKKISLLSSQTSQNDAQLKKYQQLKKSVEDRAKASLPEEGMVKLQLWFLGLFLEGFLSIRLIMDYLKSKRLKRVTSVETPATVQTSQPIRQSPLLKYLLDYTEGKNKALEKIAIRQTHPAKGKPYAIANNFIGAFLALYTLNGKQCFTDLRGEDILRVNGRARKIKNEKGKWIVSYVDTYYSDALSKHIKAIGSTATTIRIKGKQVSPQDYTLNYLIELEKSFNGILIEIEPQTFNFILKGFIEKTYQKRAKRGD